MLAAILETDDAERLYMGLSLLVSAAAAGEKARALVGFGALTALFDPPPPRHVIEAEREPFRATLSALRDTALATCDVKACAAAAQATGVSRLATISTPQFLEETAGARLVFV
ncbi:hypothetical protein C8N24_1160 [Solirubrobacter pauli]|uniref:DsrE/DsrF/DsrH-like protein n=1 Tax=Solirubrobacter pauli TaxID=166793 RepID=A0A660L8K3_9ACTN|nr:hypothetical protein [Solirubrobacter pauli]RKQ91338.1 hypothetical protein C8N24_1160 [Solirubrobacter pauli]